MVALEVTSKDPDDLVIAVSPGYEAALASDQLGHPDLLPAQRHEGIATMLA